MERENRQVIKVLVVENHREVRELIAKLVEAQGWKAIKAGSVAEALECLEGKDIQAVISDWELGDGEGSTIIAAAGRQSARRLPMVMVSSYASPELRNEAQRAGAIDLLEKPFRMDELAGLLHRELNESPLAPC